MSVIQKQVRLRVADDQTDEQGLADALGAAFGAQVEAWALAGAYTLAAVTARDAATGTVTGATLRWTDGSAGAFAATLTNGAVVEARLDHAVTNTRVTITVTRDAAGLVTSTAVSTTSPIPS